jgi:quercetin dioxygenase-like cupin family protein
MVDKPVDFEAVGVKIVHHFMYGKETHIPAGVLLGQHSHKHDHYSLLMKGLVRVTVDDEELTYSAPTIITIKAGKRHAILALKDSQWWCLHETDERDVAKIDEGLIA